MQQTWTVLQHVGPNHLGLCSNQGYGVHVYADNSKYEGNWKDDKQHGKGTLVTSDGSTYQGMWKDGKKHGQVHRLSLNFHCRNSSFHRHALTFHRLSLTLHCLSLPFPGRVPRPCPPGPQINAPANLTRSSRESA